VIARALICGLLLHAVPTAAAAQTIQYLSRFEFFVDAEHLSGDDPRFVWDANLGGALDLIDFSYGRFTLFAGYEVILGEELRGFDTNQGNYELGGFLSKRFRRFEAGAVFYHQSRHLADRLKTLNIDWNSVGGRILSGTTRGPLRLDGRFEMRGVTQEAYVDYDWELESDARARYAVHPQIALFTSGELRVVGVDGSRNRGTQTGFRGEGGVRFVGNGAAAELFLAGERRIDPYQLQFGTATWFTAGFRVSTR
jgi:hypothetical protein